MSRIKFFHGEKSTSKLELTDIEIIRKVKITEFDKINKMSEIYGILPLRVRDIIKGRITSKDFCIRKVANEVITETLFPAAK